jgi:glycerophosphoryl diester phosphodiesterase
VAFRRLLLGHRGLRGSRSIRENTLAAFDFALERGCDGIEFDVRLTQDGVAVICHDPRFAGITVDRASCAKLPQLPRLDEVLAKYAGRAFLDIELKVPGIEKSLLAALDASPPQKGFVVSSFLPEVLAEVCPIRSTVPLGFICDKKKELQRWPDLPVEFLISHHSLVTPELVEELHSVGKKVLVWTVNRKPAMLRFADWGVDGIISDKPELLTRTVRAKSSSQ